MKVNPLAAGVRDFLLLAAGVRDFRLIAANGNLAVKLESFLAKASPSKGAGY